MDYEAGKVTINKGSTISGNVANYGGGVLVSGKDITMSGGSITGNGTKGNNYRYGGGVCIAQYTDHDTQTPYSGVFTMTGGSITGNTAGSRGAGVYFLNGGTFKVSGDANVTGNTVGNSANNVYLTDTDGVLTIIGPLNGAGFGITAKSDTHFTSGWSNCMSGSDPTQFFTSDLDNRYVTLSGDEVELRDGYQIKYELNGGQFVSSYTPVSSYDGNQDVQLPGVDKITRNGYTFGGWYDNEGLTGEPYTVIPSGSTGPKTFYAKWMANTYTVEFEPNGGTIKGSYVTEYSYGEGCREVRLYICRVVRERPVRRERGHSYQRYGVRRQDILCQVDVKDVQRYTQYQRRHDKERQCYQLHLWRGRCAADGCREVRPHICRVVR